MAARSSEHCEETQTVDSVTTPQLDAGSPKTGRTDVAYIVISPVRDESEHVHEVIRSIAAQTILPMQWIIVDDGSKDETGKIIDDAAREYSWITAVHRSDRGFRQAGTGVMEAFYFGYQHIRHADWEFIVKLDGDVSMRRDYFKRCFDKFDKNPRLGIAGGIMYCNVNGRVELEDHPRFHVRGPTKIYRRACWEAVGGLIKAPGWDTVDELKANMLGWHTKSFDDINLIHSRPTGAAYGTWKDWVKRGRANYVTGYHPVFMLAKCLKRLFQKPYGVAGAALFYGFTREYAVKGFRIEDRQLICYTRRQQLNRLLFRSSIWR